LSNARGCVAMFPPRMVVLTLVIIAVGLCLSLTSRVGTSREEKMLSAWMRTATLLSQWDYTQDGKIDTWDYDTNGDSVADLWIHVRESVIPEGIHRVTRWEKDKDYDGTVDWVMQESINPAASKTTVKSIAEDTNHDGVLDYSAFLEGRRRIACMRSFDTDKDGRYDRVVYYQRGRAISETRYYFLDEIAQQYSGSTDSCGFNYREADLDMDGVADLFQVFGAMGWEELNQSLLGIPS